jgi:hypothetical protein
MPWPLELDPLIFLNCAVTRCEQPGITAKIQDSVTLASAKSLTTDKGQGQIVFLTLAKPNF